MNQLVEASQLYAAGKFLAAEQRLEALLESEPANPQARVMLGVIYSKTRRHSLAVELLSGVLRELPQQFDSIIWLAMSKKALGEFDHAIDLCYRALDLSPKDPVAFNTLGLCYLSTRRVPQAIDAFHKAIQFAPRSAASYHNLGLALRLRDDSYEACAAFKKAISLDPLNEGNYLQLYRQHLLIAATYDAILNLEEGYRRLPQSIAIQDALAISYCRANQKERGEAMFRQILAQKPGFCHSYSLWLQEEGRFKESIELLNQWLEIEPVQGMAYFCLAEAKAFKFEDGTSLIDRATEILDRPKLTSLEHMYLNYALAKAHENAKQYERAMRHFDRANELAFQTFNEGRRLDYDVVRTTNDCLRDLYSKEFLEEYRQYGSSSEMPIFIVGMIRSGTTLTDQIVSSHGMVASSGEQPFWKLDGSRITHKWFTSGVDLKDIRNLERDYLAVLNAVAGPSDRISDKQPLNYELLGLIHTVFPKAKIIHIRRNAVDTCLSIYSTHFGGGPNFAYKQDNIVFHYREYLRLMEHWRAVLPAENFFEMDYEQLVADKENVVRQVIEFCGLPWDDACLHHDEKVSMVTTPSRWQARQPVYSSSVEKWRHYEPWLGGLLELQDVSHPAPRIVTTPV